MFIYKCTFEICRVFFGVCFQKLVAKTRAICQRVGKPTQEHAGILRGLFPSSSAPKRPRLSAFDPTRPCVALPQKQKKKAARSKPSKVSVILVQDCTKGVPKGNYRKQLQKLGRIAKLEFVRTMSAREVQSAIYRGFHHLSPSGVTFLKCGNGNLVPDTCQVKDGASLIETSQARKGIIYATDSTVELVSYDCKLHVYLKPQNVLLPNTGVRLFPFITEFS